jgi:hypothetical protein
MNEIKFYGRGGQGVVTASQMLIYGFFKAGMYSEEEKSLAESMNYLKTTAKAAEEHLK